MRKDGLPYDEMGYVPPPNRLPTGGPPSLLKLKCRNVYRKLPPVPGTNSNYNTIDRIKKGEAEDRADV